MSKLVKCVSCKDKSWRRCCDKCLDSVSHIQPHRRDL